MIQPAVSIVIPNYNDEKTLAACVESVLAHTDYPQWRLVVVDAGSTDGSLQLLEKYPTVQVIRRGREGVAAALNAGFSASGGDDVVRLHADVVIETPGWLQQLVAAAYAHPAAGIVGVRLVFPDGRIQSEGRSLVGGFGVNPVQRDRRAFQPDGAAGKLQEVDGVSGALAYYRRSTLQAVGGLDENFAPAWMDDDDFCLAARARNFKVFVHGGVRAIHYSRALAPTFQAPSREDEPMLARITHQMKNAAEKRLADYWELKWGWAPYSPDLGEIRRLYGDTEICWQIGEAMRFRPTDPFPTVDCCLVTWNTLGLLRRCLESLARTDYPPDRMRVFVADNSSTDGTLEYLAELARTYPFPLQVVPLAVNTGAAIGINFAIAQGDGALVARLDDDIVVPPNWLKLLAEDLIRRPFAGCVGPKIINDNACQDIQFTYYRSFPTAYGHEDEADTGQADVLARATHVRGCCNLYRRDAFARCGLLDPRFSPSQCDDPDHQIALLAAGYEVLYDGRVRVVHKLNNGLARSAAALANLRGNWGKLLGKWGPDAYEILERSIDLSREGRYLPDDGDTSAWLERGPRPGSRPRKTCDLAVDAAFRAALAGHYDEFRQVCRSPALDRLVGGNLAAAAASCRDGTPRAALDILLSTANFAPQHAQVLLAMAATYHVLGQPDMARLAARRGLVLEPKNRELAALAHPAPDALRERSAGGGALPEVRIARPKNSAPIRRVLMVNTFEPRQPGGGEAQIEQTRAELERRGVHTDLCTGPRPDPRGYDLRAHLEDSSRPQQTLPQVKAVRAQCPDVPIVFSPRYWDLSEKAWADQAIPSLFSRAGSSEALQHGLAQLAADQLQVNGRNRAAAADPGFRGSRLYLKQLFELVDHVLPQSGAEWNQVLKHVGAKKPHTLVPNAADSARFDSASPDLFARHYPVKNYILSVGDLEPRHNQLMLLQALRGAQVSLVIVGRPLDSSYGALCRKFAPPGTLFLDSLAPDLLASAYLAARIHALPGWAEISQSANIEAALAGCALVVSDRTAEKEYFGDSAYYCDPAKIASIRQALEQAVGNHAADRPKRDRLREQFRTRWTWATSIEQTLRG